MSLNKTIKPSRITFGDNGAMGKKNIVSISFVARDLMKPGATSNTAISPAVSTFSTKGVEIPVDSTMDVPRNVTLNITGTTASTSATPVVVTGVNSEGATITENIAPAAGTGGVVTGNKAFAKVSHISIPSQSGNGAKFSVGYGSKLGIGIRNVSSSAAKVYTKSANGTESLDNADSTAFSSSAVEDNVVTASTGLGNGVEVRVYVLNYNWHLNPVNDDPVYGV